MSEDTTKVHTDLKAIRNEAKGYVCVGKNVKNDHQRFLGAGSVSVAKGHMNIHSNDAYGSYRLFTQLTGWGTLEDKEYKIQVTWDDGGATQELGRAGRAFDLLVAKNGQISTQKAKEDEEDK